MTYLIDSILMLVLGEAAFLVFYHRTTGRGIDPAKLLPNLAAGFFLLLGTRVALSDVRAWALPACLLVALGAHLVDLAQRWRRHSRDRPLSEV